MRSGRRGPYPERGSLVMSSSNHDPCAFCAIAAGAGEASVVAEDALTLAFVDLRQFHPGHVLIIPRQHVRDIRAADDATMAAVAITTARIARAVDRAFPSDGISVWHSAGAGANQEVPHLHIHVHPRRLGDNVLAVYPSAPPLPARAVLEQWAAQVREALRAELASSRVVIQYPPPP